jgi:hypothetical protein
MESLLPGEARCLDVYNGMPQHQTQFYWKPNHSRRACIVIDGSNSGVNGAKSISTPSKSLPQGSPSVPNLFHPEPTQPTSPCSSSKSTRTLYKSVAGDPHYGSSCSANLPMFLVLPTRRHLLAPLHVIFLIHCNVSGRISISFPATRMQIFFFSTVSECTTIVHSLF